VAVAEDPEEGGFIVKSNTNKNLTYNVYFSIRKQRYLCTCKWFAIKQTECSHIRKVKEEITQ
jgi:hypothetical protein